MNKRNLAAACSLALLALAGCRSSASSGVFAARKGVPDEFAVGRAAPLTVPPDFALVPPRPGQPRPQDADSSQQALDALYGGPRQVSQGEQSLLNAAGPAPTPGVRSDARNTGTSQVVNKGAATRDILNAPDQTNPQANASTPQ
ncbi:DUF3035 domain-containing protein [Sphingomonas sp.]|jgi:hypothetical protein|uniref:DUF3035 domain-containing protein n=1 Tax=Sphingomonas sp. TaxID=28214 RepID=UPI003B3B56CD